MKIIWKILTLAFLVRFIISFFVWHPDVNNHIDWGIRFWEYGPAKFYSPEANVWSYTRPNQPPGTIYIYAATRKLFETIFAFFWFMNVNIPLFPSNTIFFLETNLYPTLLKLPSILADIGIAYLIYRLFKQMDKEKIGVFGAFLFLINPAIWYNSTIWGQTDSLINFFGLLAFVLLLQKKLLWAVMALSFSLYIKISLAFFLPIFIVVLLRQKYKTRIIAFSFLTALFLIGVLTLPFSQGEPFSWLFDIYQKKVLAQQLQVITANAFNIWATLTGIHAQPHTQMLGPFTYDLWGKILFGLAALPVLYLVWKRQDYKSVFWSVAVISFAAFMLLTNMHERYLYPLFPAFTILAAENKKLLSLYWVVSGINLLNLYHFWWVPKIQFVIDIMSFSDRLAPRLLGLVNFGLFLNLYRLFHKQ